MFPTFLSHTPVPGHPIPVALVLSVISPISGSNTVATLLPWVQRSELFAHRMHPDLLTLLSPCLRSTHWSPL